VPAPPNDAVRRFSVVWTVSFAVKVAAAVVLLLLVVKFWGGL
jgi:hypothetical protein